LVENKKCAFVAMSICPMRPKSCAFVVSTDHWPKAGLYVGQNLRPGPGNPGPGPEIQARARFFSRIWARVSQARARSTWARAQAFSACGAEGSFWGNRPVQKNTGLG